MVESYLYYQWDKATLAAGYSFSHEALFATFKSVEEEVSSMFHLDVSKTAAPPGYGCLLSSLRPLSFDFDELDHRKGEALAPDRRISS